MTPQIIYPGLKPRAIEIQSFNYNTYIELRLKAIFVMNFNKELTFQPHTCGRSLKATI